jgi:hypothetical protein
MVQQPFQLPQVNRAERRKYRNTHIDSTIFMILFEQSTINNLKTIVMEWKKKAIDYEKAYKEAVKRFEGT